MNKWITKIKNYKRFLELSKLIHELKGFRNNIIARENREKLRGIKSRLDIHHKLTLCHEQPFVSMLEGHFGGIKTIPKIKVIVTTKNHFLNYT